MGGGGGLGVSTNPQMQEINSDANTDVGVATQDAALGRSQLQGQGTVTESGGAESVSGGSVSPSHSTGF